MKRLFDYLCENNDVFVNEAKDTWIKDFIERIRNIDTHGKLQIEVALYGLRQEHFYDDDKPFDIYGKLEDENRAMYSINKIIVNSQLDIAIVTTDKGNFYGLSKKLLELNPSSAALFKKRVKNTKGFVWTDKIENVETCLNSFQNKWSDRWHVDEMPTSDDTLTRIWSFYTEKDIALKAAEKASKIHKCIVVDRWHGEKIKSLEKEIKDKQQSISYYKDLIKQYEESIVEIQQEIVGYQTLKNINATDFDD